ncbi:MAG: tetratricopeptide repeat protein [Jatrophihabitantaceae bacterium]
MTGQVALHQAAALLEAGQAGAAMRLLTGYLASEPDDPYAQCLAARSLLDLDEPGRAFELARRAAARSPAEDWPIRLQTLALVNLHRFDEAQLVARQAVLVNPGSWQTHYLVAFADASSHSATGHSLAAAEQARALAPAEACTHRMAGTIALQLGQRALAVRCFNEALRLDPNDAIAQHELARAHLKQWRIAKSLQGFLAAGRLDPRLGQPAANLHQIMERAVIVLHYATLLAYFLSATAPVGVALAVATVTVAVTAWARARGGPQLLRFAGTLRTRDPLLVVWAGLLGVAAGLLVLRPLLPAGSAASNSPSAADFALTASVVSILAGVIVSWVRRSRLRRR